MNLFNLLLVCTLLSNAKLIKRRLRLSVLVSDNKEVPTLPEISAAEEDSTFRSQAKTSHSLDKTSSDGDWLTSADPSRSCTHGHPSGNLISVPSNPQDIAMRRLAADLAIAIPCVLVMTMTMTVSMAIFVQTRSETTSWPMQEFVGSP